MSAPLPRAASVETPMLRTTMDGRMHCKHWPKCIWCRRWDSKPRHQGAYRSKTPFLSVTYVLNHPCHPCSEPAPRAGGACPTDGFAREIFAQGSVHFMFRTGTVKNPNFKNERRGESRTFRRCRQIATSATDCEASSATSISSTMGKFGRGRILLNQAECWWFELSGRKQ
jgi:hypothetical protein